MKAVMTIVVLLCVGLLAGCSSAPKPTYDYDQLADFSKYRSFDWLPAEHGSEAYLTDRLKRAVVMDLTARGYLQGGAAPTMFISVKAGGTDAPGALMLTMVDGDTKRRLWEGSVAFVPPQNASPSEMDKVCQQAVGALLDNFPPTK
jgi:hypothetical protein